MERSPSSGPRRPLGWHNSMPSMLLERATAYLLTGDPDLVQDLAQEGFARLITRFRVLRDPDARPTSGAPSSTWPEGTGDGWEVASLRPVHADGGIQRSRPCLKRTGLDDPRDPPTRGHPPTGGKQPSSRAGRMMFTRLGA